MFTRFISFIYLFIYLALYALSVLNVNSVNLISFIRSCLSVDKLTWEESNFPYVIPKYFMPAFLRTCAVKLAPFDPKSFM